VHDLKAPSNPYYPEFDGSEKADPQMVEIAPAYIADRLKACGNVTRPNNEAYPLEGCLSFPKALT
jgi:hypothetical protein